ncbi:MAG: hypothetical protein DRJ03_14960, partial [Chloroflexi bacterium]
MPTPACRQAGLARYSKDALNAAHTGPLPIGAQDKFLDELEIRTALWFQSSIGITIKAMKLLLTFVICTVLDYGVVQKQRRAIYVILQQFPFCSRDLEIASVFPRKAPCAIAKSRLRPDFSPITGIAG